MTRRRRAAQPGAEKTVARPGAGATTERIRLDKWLWFARFFKTRAAAAAFVESGKVRVNGARSAKPGHGLKCRDVLTFVRAGEPIVAEVVALGVRRGPSVEAMRLYRRIDEAAKINATDPGEDASGDDAVSIDPSHDLEAPDRSA